MNYIDPDGQRIAPPPGQIGRGYGWKTNGFGGFALCENPDEPEQLSNSPAVQIITYSDFMARIDNMDDPQVGGPGGPGGGDGDDDGGDDRSRENREKWEELIIGMMHSEKAQELAREYFATPGADYKLFLKFISAELLGQWTDPFVLVQGATIGVAAFSSQSTTVYRAVSAAEAKSIRKTGRFSLSTGACEVKYFARSMKDAQWYGKRLYPTGYSVVRGTINARLQIREYWFPNVDIGAYIFPSRVLPYIKPK